MKKVLACLDVRRSKLTASVNRQSLLHPLISVNRSPVQKVNVCLRNLHEFTILIFGICLTCIQILCENVNIMTSH